MKKIFWLLPVAILLSACVTTLPNDAKTPDISAISDQNWTSNISAHKATLRSCIIANKNIQAIVNIDEQINVTTLAVETKNGQFLSCSVNPQTKQIIKIEPISERAFNNTSKFYPVGKKLPDPCKGNERIQDDEGRLMGILCY